MCSRKQTGLGSRIALTSRPFASAAVAGGSERALASPMPDPAIATTGVFAEEWKPLGDGRAPWSRYEREEER